MKKCDSCGKVIANDKEFMCPFCGAVAKKHCDHETHLNNKYYRYNDYANMDSKKASNDEGYKPKRDDAPRSPAGYTDRVKRLMKPIATGIIVMLAFSVVNTILYITDSSENYEDNYEVNSETIYELGPFEVYLEELETVDFSEDGTMNGYQYDAAIDCEDVVLDEMADSLNINVSNLYYNQITTGYDDYYSQNENTDFSGTVSAKAFYVTVAEMKSGDEIDYHGRTFDLTGVFTPEGQIKFSGVPSDLKAYNEAVYLVIPRIIIKGSENNPFYSSLEMNFNAFGYNDGFFEGFDVYETESDIAGEYDLEFYSVAFDEEVDSFGYDGMKSF